MKVIDLLNKIANETQPKIIIFDTEKYLWEKEQKEYRRYPYENNLYYSLWSDYDLTKCLNEEVEVLEEDKEIEYLKGDYILPVLPAKENEAFISGCLLALENKINELIKIYNEQIKVFNELKKGK